jgi:2-octaprenyl-6-methoxyphenol hydroxylase
MTDRYDIVIAGGGMVGISLALELSRTLPAAALLLVEGFPLPGSATISDYHPSFDARSTALSHGSRLVYEALDLWSVLEAGVCPIERIHVSSRGRFGSALLAAADHGWPALGYVVENPWLGNTLARALQERDQVSTLSPARVVDARAGGAGVRVSIEADAGREVDAGLLVVADGANSLLCERLGVGVSSKPYGQHALVANVVSAEHHTGCAYERFTDEGPLALLPLLPADTGHHRSALVWTLPPERAEALAASADEAFLAALQERFGYRLGRLLAVGERHVYPLSLVQSEEQVRQGVVVMGNAAHALHPVAGQGFNLALRDVAELAATLAGAMAQGQGPGELRVLEDYRRRQQGDQARTIAFSDRVPALFMHADPVLSLGRDLALAGLDVLPALKREFVRQAAGVASLGSGRRG